MPTRKKPGSKKGQPKPLKRTLDAGFPKRLDAAMQGLGVDAPALARRLKCSRAVIHKYLNGKSKQIEALLLFEMADELDVSARWLLLPDQPTMNKERSLGPDENLALNIFAQLSPDARGAWFRQGEDLIRLQPPLIATPATPFPNAKVKQ